MKNLRSRIRRRLRDCGKSAAKASLEAGLSRNAIGEILSESVRGNKNPSISTLERIASSLDCDLEFLIGKQDVPRRNGEHSSTVTKIPVAGTVEAGAFRDMTGAEPWLDHEQELEQIEAPRSVQFPRARHFAFRVRGDSMNATKPRPIMEGEMALFVDVVDTDLPPADGKIYLVRRTIDGGQTYEWTIKRARVYRDRVELVPESSNKAHKPFIIPRLAKSKPEPEGHEIVAVGLLYAMHYSFE